MRINREIQNKYAGNKGGHKVWCVQLYMSHKAHILRKTQNIAHDFDKMKK